MASRQPYGGPRSLFFVLTVGLCDFCGEARLWSLLAEDLLPELGGGSVAGPNRVGSPRGSLQIPLKPWKGWKMLEKRMTTGRPLWISERKSWKICQGPLGAHDAVEAPKGITELPGGPKLVGDHAPSHRGAQELLGDPAGAPRA